MRLKVFKENVSTVFRKDGYFPMSRLKPLDITLCGMFIVIIAIGANITSIFPFFVIGGVPITLQTFFVILAGFILGSRLGTIAVIVYVLMGLFGLPVFAQFTGGLQTILRPTFGFILSFILTAYAVGKISERNKNVFTYCVAAIIGLIINYVIGTNWMYFAYRYWAEAPGNFSYTVAWLWMVPPLIKDLPLSIMASLFAYRFNTSVWTKKQWEKFRMN